MIVLQPLQSLRDYLYDVFVVRFDGATVLGLCAQALFMSRFVVQWVASERASRSIIPIAFWYLSILGGLLLLIYAISRRDPVFILGQSLGLVIYIRNVVLLRRSDTAV